MNEMNMSFDADKDKLVPGVGGYSHDNFFSLENESSFPHNQSDDNLSDRLNENETGHNILYSSENGNSVESNQRKGNFNKGEISNLNDIVLIPLFTNKNTSITFKETKSTEKTKPLFHTNIEISKKPEVIEDIKDSKKGLLQKNIKYMEDLSKTIDNSIKELKVMFEKINERKEVLKLKIQETFTKIRSKINDREDELLLEVDKEFNKYYFKEEIEKDFLKLPNKINESLKKCNNIEDEWNNENKLCSLIYNCLNIENNIKEINLIKESIDKSNEFIELNFFPKEDDDESLFVAEISKENGLVFCLNSARASFITSFFATRAAFC